MSTNQPAILQYSTIYGDVFCNSSVSMRSHEIQQIGQSTWLTLSPTSSHIKSRFTSFPFPNFKMTILLSTLSEKRFCQSLTGIKHLPYSRELFVELCNSPTLFSLPSEVQIKPFPFFFCFCQLALASSPCPYSLIFCVQHRIHNLATLYIQGSP